MLCRCCRRARNVNKNGLCDDCLVCLHCEQLPTFSDLGLCDYCHGSDQIRHLYERRGHWSPAWEMHLRRKTRQIQRELKRRRPRYPLEIDRSEG